jgi:hypothetical protein
LLELHNKLTETLLNLPEILTVDLYNEQVKNLKNGQEIPFDFPAVFLEYSDISYKQIGAGNQQGDLTLTLHIFIYNLGNPVTEMFWIRNIVHEAVQGLRGESFSSLIRSAERFPDSWDNILELEVNYQCTFQDNSVYLLRDYEPADGPIKIKTSFK